MRYTVRIYIALLILITGFVLGLSLPWVTLRPASAAVCEATGRSYKEAQLQLWVVAVKGSGDRLMETGPLQGVSVRLSGTRREREQLPTAVTCGALVGHQETIRTDAKGYARLTPVNSEFNPFTLTLADLPAGTELRGATVGTISNPKKDQAKESLTDLTFQEGSERTLKIYYEVSGDVPRGGGVGTSAFDRTVGGIARRVIPGRAGRPTPTPTPQPLNSTPETGSHLWLLIAALWGIPIGWWLGRVKTVTFSTK